MEDFRTISGNYNLAENIQSLLQTKSVNIQAIHLQCDTTAAPVNIQLPTIAQMAGFLNFQIFINDVSNNAATNNITLLIAGSDLINHAATAVINTNGMGGQLQIVGLEDWFFDTVAAAAVSIPLGGINTSSDLNGFSMAPAAAGIRSIKSGEIKDTFAAGNSYGTLVGSLDLVTGIWTAPATGYYDFTTIMSVTAAADFDLLSSVANPNGFISNGVNSQDTGVTPIIDFDDFIGSWQAGITDTTGGIIICSNKYALDYNTSQVLITASYNGRHLTAGTQLVCRWLNKGKNTIIGNAGNSLHFSATHLRVG
jgi:hypothetical protein